MKVILLTDVKKVGRRHEMVEVASGYAQNVLLPQQLATPATPENIKRFQKEEGRAQDKKALDQTLLEKNIKELEGKSATLSARANDAGKLFETIHSKQVAEAVKKQHAISIPIDSIQMEDIKNTGEYAVHLTGGKVTVSLTVTVVAL